jgi:hypothetical protein
MLRYEGVRLHGRYELHARGNIYVQITSFDPEEGVDPSD